MSSNPEASGVTAPVTKPQPAPGAPPAELSAALSAEADAAMTAAMTGAAAPRHERPVLSSDTPKAAPGTRGPRVVQAGREHRTGLVVSVGPTDIFLEFGPKELGVTPRAQWPDDQVPVQGGQVEVVVDHRDNDGLLICSRPGQVQKADWELLEPGQVIEARVTGVNKGGLELEVANHRAFMPASQVSLEHIQDLSVFVGEKLKCQVSRVERSGKGNIVLSRRELLAQERKELAEKMKSTLSEGQVVAATVRKIMPFGAFADIGGVDGLIHSSDLTHDRVGHGEKFVEKYVKVGDKVNVRILKIDWEAGRISLGLKQTQSDPFAVAANDIKEGLEITGRVTKLLEFGAFVEVSPGVEGLVHISEMAWRRVGKVDEVVKQDEIIKCKVLKIDPESRRISLSIKACIAPPEPVAPEGDAGGGGAPGRAGGGGGGRGGFGGRGKPDAGGFLGVFGRRGRKGADTGRPLEEIQKESPELRRLREKFGGKNLKGGIG